MGVFLMNKLIYNQFQSIYDINNSYLLVDFLCNEIKRYRKKGRNQPIYEYSDKYQTQMVAFDKKLNKQLTDKMMNLTIVTDLLCNMKCQYCYEFEFSNKISTHKLSPELLVGFIKQVFINNSYQLLRICILGGEPLMEHNIQYLDLLICMIRGLGFPTEIYITTNGLKVLDYIQFIKEWKVKELQITLDGMSQTQNTRRTPLESIDGFYVITRGISALLKNETAVSLRVNVDRNNINEIPELAKYIISQDWSGPLFFLYLYPITKSGNDKYIIRDSELSIFKLVLSIMLKQDNEIRSIFNYDFHGIDYLNNIINKKFPTIRRSYCGVAGGQYVVFNDGHIYSCWWGISKEAFCIGTISETGVVWNEQELMAFSQRDICHMQQCGKCKFKYLCGDGCTYKEWMDKGTIINGNCAEFDNIFYEYLKYCMADNKFNELIPYE